MVAASPPLPAAAWSRLIRSAGSSGLAASTKIEARFAGESHDVVITSRNPLENLVETRVWAILEPDAAPPPVRPGGRTSRGSPPQIFGGVSMLGSRTVLAPDGKTFARFSRLRNLTRRARAAGPGGNPRPVHTVQSPAFEFFFIDSNQPTGNPPTTSAQAVAVVYSKDSRRLLMISSSGEAPLLEGILHGGTYGGPMVDADLEFQVLDLPSLRPAGPVVRVSRPVGSIALGPDGSRLAVMSAGTTVTREFWQTMVDSKTRKPASERKKVQKTLSYLDNLKIYDLETGQAAPQSFRVPQPDQPAMAPVDGLLFSPDGRWLLVRSARPVAYIAGKYQLQPTHLVDAASLRPAVPPLRITRASGAGVQTTQSLNYLQSDERLAAFSPDSRLVAFADGGNLVAVFETATGKPVSSPLNHTGRVVWIDFSPDSQRLATAGAEGVARLWSATTGAPLGRRCRTRA